MINAPPPGDKKRAEERAKREGKETGVASRGTSTRGANEGGWPRKRGGKSKQRENGRVDGDGRLAVK